MSTCLTDQQLEEFVQGLASAAQASAWKEHLAICDGCAIRLAHSGRANLGYIRLTLASL